MDWPLIQHLLFSVFVPGVRRQGIMRQRSIQFSMSLENPEEDNSRNSPVNKPEADQQL